MHQRYTRPARQIGRAGWGRADSCRRFHGVARYSERIVDFNQWLGKQPHRHKIVIAGNHDLMFERHPGAARELLGNAIYLENSSTEVAGLKIWGSPVQPEFNNWAFNVARGAAIRTPAGRGPPRP